MSRGRYIKLDITKSRGIFHFYIKFDMLRIVQYTSPKHREAGVGGVISDWYRKELSVRARQEFDDVLRDLSKIRAQDWTTRDFKPLVGAHSGVSEIRFYRDKIEYRPLCFLLPPAEVGAATLDVLVLLIGAYKKGAKWTPSDARNTALDRKKQVLENRRIVHEYRF